MNDVQLFDAEFFIGNRRRLREAFGGTAPIVITAHSQLQRSADQAYPFYQNNNFWYLTGINEPDYLLVLDKDREYLIAPSLSEYQRIFDGEAASNLLSQASGIPEILDNQAGWKRLNRRLKTAKHVATLQPPPAFLEPYAMFTNPSHRRLVRQLKISKPDLELIDIRQHLGGLRMVKSGQELQAIQTAIKHTQATYALIEKNYKNYNNEADILVEIDRQFIKERVAHAYPPIIGNGLNAATLHYTANNKPINARKTTLIDAAASFGRYGADITRAFCQKPTKRQQSVYGAVAAVQEYAISLLKPGVFIEEYETQVRQYMGEKLRELGLTKTISAKGIKLWYPHLTSHFLGLDPHDAADYKKPLAPGMVLTVEPGIYIKAEEIGIRLEDDILITKTGNKNLSADIPKTLC